MNSFTSVSRGRVAPVVQRASGGIPQPSGAFSCAGQVGLKLCLDMRRARFERALDRGLVSEALSHLDAMRVYYRAMSGEGASEVTCLVTRHFGAMGGTR